MAEGAVDGGAAAWAAEYVASVENGHASRTMELARALTAAASDGGGDGDAAAAVGLEELRRRLAGEAKPVARNRMLREWLRAHRAQVLARESSVKIKWKINCS